MLKKLLGIVSGDMFNGLRANGKLLKKVHDFKNDLNDPWLKLSPEVLLDRYDQEKKRSDRIEDKARGMILGTSLSISILGGGIGMIINARVMEDQIFSYKITSGIFLFSSMLYLMLSGYFSAKVFVVSPFCVPQIEMRPEIQSIPAWKYELIACIKNNEKYISIKANTYHVSASFLRNGLFMLALFNALAIISIYV